jgi:hypothetical protein
MAEEKRSTFEVAYEEAFTLACEALLQKDIRSCCTQAGAEVVDRSGNRFEVKIKFINRIITIQLPEFSFSSNNLENIHIWEKILILHYLTNSDDSALTDGLINYKQVKDGAMYYPTFEKRSIKPLVNTFGEEPRLLIESSKLLGGKEIDYGDVGVKIMALPHVPIIFVIWKGDEEFPSDGGILFDASIEKRLSAEDIAVLCQQIVFKIIKYKHEIEPH